MTIQRGYAVQVALNLLWLVATGDRWGEYLLGVLLITVAFAMIDWYGHPWVMRWLRAPLWPRRRREKTL